jgi:hypothetical protein
MAIRPTDTADIAIPLIDRIDAIDRSTTDETISHMLGLESHRSPRFRLV